MIWLIIIQRVNEHDKEHKFLTEDLHSSNNEILYNNSVFVHEEEC